MILRTVIAWNEKWIRLLTRCCEINFNIYSLQTEASAEIFPDVTILKMIFITCG